MTPNTPMTELSEWRDARKAFLALDTKDVRQSGDTLEAINRLAAAEDALFTASQSLRAPAGEVVAWRWRQRGNKHWIYDPKQEWVEDNIGYPSFEFERLYASPPSEGVKVKGRLPTTEEIHDLLVLYGEFGSGLEAHHRKADECAGEIIKLFTTLGGTP